VGWASLAVNEGVGWRVGGEWEGWEAGRLAQGHSTPARSTTTCTAPSRPRTRLVGVDLEDLQAALLIRQPDLDLHLQPPRPQQRLVQHVLRLGG
jgi:hypothetical protein